MHVDVDVDRFIVKAFDYHDKLLCLRDSAYTVRSLNVSHSTLVIGKVVSSVSIVVASKAVVGSVSHLQQ